MSKVTVFEAKTRFGERLERVSRGEEVVITWHNKVVARLVPEGPQRLDEVLAFSRLSELAVDNRRASGRSLDPPATKLTLERWSEG